jgi:hypothetical protein
MALEPSTVLLKKLIRFPEALLKLIQECLQLPGLIALTVVTLAATLVRGHSLEFLALDILLPHLTVLQDLK